MDSITLKEDSLEIGDKMNQGTLSRYSIKYLLPIFLIPPITGEDPFLFDYVEGQEFPHSNDVVAQSKSDLSEDLNEPLQVDLHEMSQSTSDIELGSYSSISEDYELLESFALNMVNNSVHLPGEINKLIYENIDDLLI